MRARMSTLCNSLVLCLALAACGGSGSPPVLVASPRPAPTPEPFPPTPTPTPPPPPPAGPIGLVSSEPFAVLAVSSDYSTGADGNFVMEEAVRADVSFQYRGSDGSYVISLPNHRPGTLFTQGYSGSYRDSTSWLMVSGTWNELLDGDTGRQDAYVELRWPQGTLNPDEQLTYTSYGSWGDDPDVDGYASSGTRGAFAYGIPTEARDVPTTGTASYTARVMGNSDNAYPGGNPIYMDLISGLAFLSFDFAAGTLEGEMQPVLCPWDCYPLGTYTFVETVYSTGSTSFSGQFAIDGEVVPSWFEGVFNGPQAAEIMARWHAPYILDEGTGTMSGIWVGLKD